MAEHSWRLALTALFLHDEFPALDRDRVIRMCLIHDLGECFTGDIPSFLKSGGDEERERSALEAWVASLPAPYSVELKTLYEIIVLPVTIRVVKKTKEHEGTDVYDNGINYNVWKIFNLQ